MKVVSPATTSVREFVPRSENLKKAPKVDVSPLRPYAQVQYSKQKASGFRYQSQGDSLPATTGYALAQGAGSRGDGRSRSLDDAS